MQRVVIVQRFKRKQIVCLTKNILCYNRCKVTPSDAEPRGSRLRRPTLWNDVFKWTRYIEVGASADDGLSTKTQLLCIIFRLIKLLIDFVA